MKKRLALCFCLITMPTLLKATVAVEIDAGILRNATGTSPVPVGGLLELIASPSGSAANFSAPTATSFVSGDNIVVATFAMNYAVQTGETDSFVTLVLQNTTGPASATTFDAGDPLLLRWYPTLTTASTSPGIGTTYGQFRSDTGELGGSAWVTPADGSSISLVFNTMAAGGTHAEATGYASNVVVSVPEPTTTGIIGGAAIGLLGLVKLRRRS